MKLLFFLVGLRKQENANFVCRVSKLIIQKIQTAVGLLKNRLMK